MSTSILNNKVVLLTGATKGLGLAIAQTLLQAGCHLMLCSRTASDLSKVAESLQTAYPQQTIKALATDVSDASAVKGLVQEALTQWGRIDILINNAAIASAFALFQEDTPEQISAQIDINLKGPLYLIHQVLPHMVNQGQGDIININSIAGKTVYPYCSVYLATKFALDGFSKSLAEEQRPNDIRISSIYPGRIDTPMWDSLEPGVQQNPQQMLTPQDVANAVKYALEQPRHLEVRDITLLPAHCD